VFISIPGKLIESIASRTKLGEMEIVLDVAVHRDVLFLACLEDGLYIRRYRVKY